MKLIVNRLCLSGLLLSVAILAGCGSLPAKPRDSATSQTSDEVARFRVGETVVVSFSGAPEPIPNHEEPIKEDGTITLVNIGKIYALGKTTGELQNEILTNYVPKYYIHLTVTVKSPTDRVYYIGGQVNGPGVKTYLGDTTVSQAIQAAGDFNNFASHTVTLTRADKKRIKVNVDKVKEGKETDPPVYPNDSIDVPRSVW